jgi:hypothetical protein
MPERLKVNGLPSHRSWPHSGDIIQYAPPRTFGITIERKF